MTFDQSIARGSDMNQTRQLRLKLAHFARRGIRGFAYVSHASFIVLGQSPDLVNKASTSCLASLGCRHRESSDLPPVDELS